MGNPLIAVRLQLRGADADLPPLIQGYGTGPEGELAVALRTVAQSPQDYSGLVVLQEGGLAKSWSGAEAPRMPSVVGEPAALAQRMETFLTQAPKRHRKGSLTGAWRGTAQLDGGGLRIRLTRGLTGIGTLTVEGTGGVWRWRLDRIAGRGSQSGQSTHLGDAIRAAFLVANQAPGPKATRRVAQRPAARSLYLSAAWLRGHPEHVHLAGLPGLEMRGWIASKRRAGEVCVQIDGEVVSVPGAAVTRQALSARTIAALQARPSQAKQASKRAERSAAQAPNKSPRVAPAPVGQADVLLGVRAASPQWGMLGERHNGQRVALDLNETHTISLFGVQGGGKSYTLGCIAEMASMPIPGINQLPNPLGTVIFHYSPTQDYQPEFTSMVAANSNQGQLQVLRERYGAEPDALDDVVLLVPQQKLAARRKEFPKVRVEPLLFSASELSASHWRFLLGTVGNGATYIRQLTQVMRSLRGHLTLDSLREGIDASRMTEHLRELAHTRLELAAQYIDDGAQISDYAAPGRLVIVDLRDEFIEKDEALGLFVVLLQLFAEATHEGQSFNKLVVFDEAHKYIDSPELVAGLVETVREMRHKGTSVLVASQDPPSVPVALIELSSAIVLHKFNSPAWLRHLQKANAAFKSVTPGEMAGLGPGEAYVWASKATDAAFTDGAVRMRCRPRVTQHGGATKTAVRR